MCDQSLREELAQVKMRSFCGCSKEETQKKIVAPMERYAHLGVRVGFSVYRRSVGCWAG